MIIPGEEVQIRVTALFSDGTTGAVDGLTEGTAYTSSSSRIATVDANGLVRGVDRGTAAILATNQGASSVVRITVVDPDDPLTQVEGFVVDEDGKPVEGALVEVLQYGLTILSGTDGFFCIGCDGADGPPTHVRASRFVEGTSFRGEALDLVPVPEGATDAGVITLAPTKNGLTTQMYRLETFDHARSAVRDRFSQEQPDPFDVLTADGSQQGVLETIIPVLNFPLSNFDITAFYNVGPNGSIDSGSSEFSPKGDDISLVPPERRDIFGTTFRGFLFVPNGGDVSFSIDVDDLFVLIVNGSTIASEFSGGPVTRSGTARGLPAGLVPFVLHFADGRRKANLRVRASGGGLPGGIIPPSFFFVD